MHERFAAAQDIIQRAGQTDRPPSGMAPCVTTAHLHLLQIPAVVQGKVTAVLEQRAHS